MLVFPFILVIYILIELLENETMVTKSKKMLQGPLAPLLGAATGLIPQCGFSVMAAKLYDRGLIRTGTIIAVFLATSDEALIILLGSSATNPEAAMSIMPLILIKLGVAVLFGYLINFLLPEEPISAIEPLYDHSHEADRSYSCGREHDGKSALGVYLVEPLLHSLKITLYLLLVNLVVGCIVYAVGEENLSAGFIGGPFEPFITAAIGLIPNCASSVIITQGYIDKMIQFGGCVAGLCTNAGMGFVVLLKNVKKLKRNILLILTIYLISVLVGLAINSVLAVVMP